MVMVFCVIIQIVMMIQRMNAIARIIARIKLLVHHAGVLVMPDDPLPRKARYHVKYHSTTTGTNIPDGRWRTMRSECRNRLGNAVPERLS